MKVWGQIAEDAELSLGNALSLEGGGCEGARKTKKIPEDHKALGDFVGQFQALVDCSRALGQAPQSSRSLSLLQLLQLLQLLLLLLLLPLQL